MQIEKVNANETKTQNKHANKKAQHKQIKHINILERQK